MTTIDRKENQVFYVFAKGGIENYIYKSLQNKKSYTVNYFKKDFNIK